MSTYRVLCITTNTPLGNFNSESEAKSAVLSHCFDGGNKKHDYSILVTQSSRNSDVVSNAIRQTRYRIVCLDKNYKSNWCNDEMEAHQKLFNYQKKTKTVEAFIIEDAQLIHKSISIDELN